MGNLDERLDDPLGAVHEYEQATRLDSSEQNYFEWGTELLLHRRLVRRWKCLAKDRGSIQKSWRLLSAWGAASTLGELTMRPLALCAASDLRPDDSTPYLFLGRMESAAPQPLPCVDEKLARFVKDQPEMLLATSLALRFGSGSRSESAGLQAVKELLQKAVTIDPRARRRVPATGDSKFRSRRLRAGD